MLNVVVDKCVGCKLCEKVCPFDAIVVVIDDKKKKTIIIKDNCNLCGACCNACKYGVLSIERPLPSPEELAKYSGVGVVAECEMKHGELVLKKFVYELLKKGQELAYKLTEELFVVVLGKKVDQFADILIQHGADVVYICEHELLKNYSTDGYTNVLSGIVSKDKPAIILFGATPNGRDLAPRLAARLKLGLTADCTALDIDHENQLVQTRPAFGGNIMASIISPNSRPQMATVRPNVFPAGKPDPTRKGRGKIERVKVNLNLASFRTKLRESVDTQGEEEKIEEANVLVSVGRGVGSKESIPMFKELAKELNGVMSSSRMLVELGWTNYPLQVGQSGKTVAPNLYIACGISGAIQHIVGMSSADYIIAINSDPEAPIFKLANLGIIGDVKEIVPVLLKRIRENKKLKN